MGIRYGVTIINYYYSVRIFETAIFVFRFLTKVGGVLSSEDKERKLETEGEGVAKSQSPQEDRSGKATTSIKPADRSIQLPSPPTHLPAGDKPHVTRQRQAEPLSS